MGFLLKFLNLRQHLCHTLGRYVLTQFKKKKKRQWGGRKVNLSLGFKSRERSGDTDIGVLGRAKTSKGKQGQLL